MLLYILLLVMSLWKEPPCRLFAELSAGGCGLEGVVKDSMPA